MKFRIDFYPKGIGKIKDVSFFVVKQPAIFARWMPASPRFETLEEAKEFLEQYKQHEFVGIYINAAARIEEEDIFDFLAPPLVSAKIEYAQYNSL